MPVPLRMSATRKNDRSYYRFPVLRWMVVLALCYPKRMPFYGFISPPAAGGWLFKLPSDCGWSVVERAEKKKRVTLDNRKLLFLLLCPLIIRLGLNATSPLNPLTGIYEIQKQQKCGAFICQDDPPKEFRFYNPILIRNLYYYIDNPQYSPESKEDTPRKFRPHIRVTSKRQNLAILAGQITLPLPFLLLRCSLLNSVGWNIILVLGSLSGY